MPTYEYECFGCDKVLEIFQSITAEKLTKCPECGGKMKRLIGTGSGLVFKGTGFYETDFKTKKGTKEDSSAPKKSDSKKTETKATSSESKSLKKD